MRSLRQISITVLAGALLIGATSIALAQQTDEASELNKIVIELYKAGQYADAIPIAQQVLAMRERALGRDHPDVATSLNNLALLYSKQGRYADAEPLYQRALTIDEKTLGRDHPAVATALNNLALLYDGTELKISADELSFPPR
jgi:tetratricopeptide (TPR) repeat protein